MHHGLKNYLDGKIFLAPLDNPRTILDIGCAFYHLYMIPSVCASKRRTLTQY